MAKKAERNNPPIGKFVDVGGVHYPLSSGEAAAVALVLLHSNGNAVEDFACSGHLN